jgi:hypothetical protein
MLQEETIKVAAIIAVKTFSASSSWISIFKQCHDLVFKKLTGESAVVDTYVSGDQELLMCVCMCASTCVYGGEWKTQKRDKVDVVMTMKLSLNQCSVLPKNLVCSSP